MTQQQIKTKAMFFKQEVICQQIRLTLKSVVLVPPNFIICFSGCFVSVAHEHELRP